MAHSETHGQVTWRKRVHGILPLLGLQGGLGFRSVHSLLVNLKYKIGNLKCGKREKQQSKLSVIESNDDNRGDSGWPAFSHMFDDGLIQDSHL